MTLTDPLLKELKGHIANLVLSSSPPYGDDNETVFLLCHCIESVFLKGLIRHDGFTPWRTDSFSWFYQLVRKYHRVIPLSFKLAFEDVLSDPKTRTHVGKTRLLIRSCLKRKCLQIPIQFHVENQDYDDPNLRVNYCPKGSILGHEILSQIFLSLVLQLGNYDFNLDLSNASFLDESWQIPLLVKAEFVPCDKLGLTLGFPMGFAVVADIIENSLAAEVEDIISVGDIMDEFNGIAVRNLYGSKIESLFRRHRSQPFKITFIKATDRKGQLYLPAIKLYRILGLDPERLTFTKPTKIDQRLSPDLDLSVDNMFFDAEQNVLGTNSISTETNEHRNMSSCQTSTMLIQGLPQEELEQNETYKNVHSTPKNLMDDDENTLQKQPALMSYCDILSELSCPNIHTTPVDLAKADSKPNSNQELTDCNCLLDSEIGLLNNKPPSSLMEDWKLPSNFVLSREKGEIPNDSEHQRRSINEPEQQMDYPKYYDDSNPLVV